MQIYARKGATPPSMSQKFSFHYREILLLLLLLLQIRAELDYQPTDLKKTIIEMAYNLIDSGFIMKTAKYKEVKERKADSEAKKEPVTKTE